ncbi:hypothetical protein P692DRAFT_201316830 [Suillus brevipes Sb2]|nr:hypothetical protein P692DRAFT_201316830 [Suillus brevipes Sb2]
MQGSCRMPFLSLAASSSHPVLQSISPHPQLPLPYKYDGPTDSGRLGIPQVAYFLMA